MILNRIIITLLINLGLTVAIEAAASFLAGVRSLYGQTVILLTNILTNPIINVILLLVSFYISPNAYWFFVFPLEAVVVLTEGMIYKKMLSLKMNCFLFSLIMNACSYFLGTLIVKII